MTPKKTRFSTTRQRATEEREAIDRVIAGLAGRDPGSLSEEEIEQFSDLSRSACARLSSRWNEIDLPVRLALVREMVSRFETTTEYHFDRALIASLSDEEVDVKLLALEGLTDTTDPGLLEWLVSSLPSEPSAVVRAAAIQVAGQFILASELGSLKEELAVRIQQLVLSVMKNDPDAEVRLQGLESAAYLSGHPEVIAAIDDAWLSPSHDDQVSALRAMGRQGDPRWSGIIMNQFRSNEPELRFEAARAAATVGSQAMVPQLVELTNDEDAEVRMAAIESLGSIGGEVAVSVLRELEQSDSPDVADAAGAALEEALLSTTPTRAPRQLW